MKEMIGGCCVCSDERGWAENPLVYCDGHGCSVAVHQGKHPTARLAEPGLLPTVTASPTLAATASSLSPLPSPRPAPFCGPGLTPRVRGGTQGVCVVHVGESACGLDCHVIRRSLKCHLVAACVRSRGSRDFPRRWLEERGCGASGGHAGGWGCAPRLCPGGCGLVWARGDPSPFIPAPFCRSVSGDVL